MANNKFKAIYVVGGEVSDAITISVVVFSLETHEFKNCAPLNQARINSSSTIAGETLYVFGGCGNDYNLLDTIEALDVSSPSSKWETIRSQNFTKRYRAVVCSLNSDRILICGGYYVGLLNDVLVLETKTKITRKVTDAPMAFYNNWNNQAYVERDGVVLALVNIVHRG